MKSPTPSRSTMQYLVFAVLSAGVLGTTTTTPAPGATSASVSCKDYKTLEGNQQMAMLVTPRAETEVVCPSGVCYRTQWKSSGTAQNVPMLGTVDFNLVTIEGGCEGDDARYSGVSGSDAATCANTFPANDGMIAGIQAYPGVDITFQRTCVCSTNLCNPASKTTGLIALAVAALAALL